MRERVFSHLIARERSLAPRGLRSCGILFGPEHVGRPMRLREWLRASQVILFEASIIPACVGTVAAVSAGARFDSTRFALIVVSLVGIQWGANLFKGFHEGQDRTTMPAAPGSWFAFDSGAAVGLTKDPRTVLRAGYLGFGVGVAAGLLLVILTANVLLLAFGIAGGFLAWSYSSPPLKLSYRGIGEISTILAFGPIMTVGATVAFGDAGLDRSFFASVVLGFLAAAISFVRYFPNRDEDVSKGKRTPVTIFGIGPARRVFFGLFLAALLVGIVSTRLGGVLWFVVLAVFALIVFQTFPKQAERPEQYHRAIALTIATHVFVGLALIAYFAFGL